VKALGFPTKWVKIDVLISLKMRGDADLSGAGCGSSASPVLRRVRLE